MTKSFNVVFTLARRFFLSKSSDRFLSFISWVSIIGVALGVLALTVVTSVINGFEGELVRVISGVNGDVILYTRGNPISQPELIDKKVKSLVPGVKAITSSFVTELMISSSDGVSGAILEGIDVDNVGEATDLPKMLIEGRFPEYHLGQPEVVLGKSLAQKMNVKLGDQIRLIAPFVGGQSNGESLIPRAVSADVVGIVGLGMYDYDSRFIFSDLRSVQDFLNQPGVVTSFKIKLLRSSESSLVAQKLSDSFGAPFRAKDWGQLNKNLFYAIELEKIVISISLALIIVVAAFNVISTLMMMIHDKTKEVAILKTMGLRPSQSFKLFCWIGMVIGVVGTFFGVLLGLGLNEFIKNVKWIDLPADIYHIDFLPVVVRWTEVGWIIIVALLICFLATLYPSFRVSRQSPLEGVRYD